MNGRECARGRVILIFTSPSRVAEVVKVYPLKIRWKRGERQKESEKLRDRRNRRTMPDT